MFEPLTAASGRTNRTKPYRSEYIFSIWRFISFPSFLSAMVAHVLCVEIIELNEWEFVPFLCVCVRVREWWIYVLCVGANSILKCNSHNSKVKHVKWKRENSMFIVFCVCATFKCYACACACAGCVCKLLILNFSFANVLFCFIA